LPLECTMLRIGGDQKKEGRRRREREGERREGDGANPAQWGELRER